MTSPVKPLQLFLAISICAVLTSCASKERQFLEVKSGLLEDQVSQLNELNDVKAARIHQLEEELAAKTTALVELEEKYMVNSDQLDAVKAQLNTADKLDKLELHAEIGSLNRKLQEKSSEQYLEGIDLALGNLKVVCRQSMRGSSSIWGTRQKPYIDFMVLNGSDVVYQSSWELDDKDDGPAAGTALNTPVPLRRMIGPEDVLRH